MLILRRTLAAGALAALAITTAYLESDLSVVWSVLERDVRSAEKSPDDRHRAEAEFIGDAADEDLVALFETDVIQIALAQGEFSETNGIHLSDDRRIATFPIGEILNGLDKKQNDEPTVFSLRWKDR